jgi:hypothetical protein
MYICKVSKLYPRKAAGGALCFRYKKPNSAWAEKSTGSRNRKEALDFLRQFQRRAEESGLPTDLAKFTVAQATAQYVGERTPPFLSEKTHKNECYYREQLIRRLGSKRLAQIGYADFLAYRNDRLQGKSGPPVKARVINLELHILRAVLKRANLWSPIAPHYQPLAEPKSDVGRALTHEELHRLEATAENSNRWKEVYWVETLAANTGLRGGELKKLRLGVIDLEKSELRVLRATTKNDQWPPVHSIEPQGTLGGNAAC